MKQTHLYNKYTQSQFWHNQALHEVVLPSDRYNEVTIHHKEYSFIIKQMSHMYVSNKIKKKEIKEHSSQPLHVVPRVLPQAQPYAASKYSQHTAKIQHSSVCVCVCLCVQCN